MFINILNSISQKIIFYLFRKINTGYLTLVIENCNETYRFGNIKSEIKPTIKINDRTFFNDLLIKQGLGFAESYMKNKWETDNLYDTLDLFAKNPQISINKRLTNLISFVLTPIKFVFTNFKYYLQKDEREDIQKHYDLSNEMFSLFLDESMVYSCGIFKKLHESLNTSQINKFETIINGLNINSKDKFLDIGFGWGGLCKKIHDDIGCDIDGVTLSKAQLNYVTQNTEISDQINFNLMDFRLINKKYDKIASIEMLEALNYTQIPIFFRKINEILNSNGKLFVQVITIPESRFDSYKKNTDFIQKYIFPNGMIHPENRIVEAAEKYANLKVEKIQDISEHYVQTLKLWKSNFNKNKSEILSLGYDEIFIKKWNYYFDYCATGFNNNLIGNSQIIFTKSGE